VRVRQQAQESQGGCIEAQQLVGYALAKQNAASRWIYRHQTWQLQQKEWQTG
jgi:hypothetical protein